MDGSGDGRPVDSAVVQAILPGVAVGYPYALVSASPCRHLKPRVSSAGS